MYSEPLCDVAGTTNCMNTIPTPTHSGSEWMSIGQKSITFDPVNIFEFYKKLIAGKELEITMTYEDRKSDSKVFFFL